MPGLRLEGAGAAVWVSELVYEVGLENAAPAYILLSTMSVS